MARKYGQQHWPPADAGPYGHSGSNSMNSQQLPYDPNDPVLGTDMTQGEWDQLRALMRKQCSTLVDNALSASSPNVTVCVQCAPTCCTRPCACMSCSFTRRVSTRCLVRLRVGGDLVLRDL